MAGITIYEFDALTACPPSAPNASGLRAAGLIHCVFISGLSGVMGNGSAAACGTIPPGVTMDMVAGPANPTNAVVTQAHSVINRRFVVMALTAG